MRLLNTGTILLQEFTDHRDLRYAILSHRWQDEEITYQDIQNKAASKKSGYLKVLKCCSHAARHGYEWLWVDTCCIDKTSSAELSEAINSMYRWYENAAVCYAYLSDIDIPPERSCSVVGKESKRLIGFKKSIWWTRGWTLQELIAPPVVEFLDKGWELIGSKTSLSSSIEERTGIDKGLLTGFKSLEDFSIAQRLSWAAHRTTTRVEDTAYCLLGLFDVNMPMLYGEGEKAFIRLQEEIMKSSDDHSIFAWTLRDHKDSENYYGLLAPSPKMFANGGKIVRAAKRWSETTYSMTNRGLSITLPMVKWSLEIYLVALNCCFLSENIEHRVGMFVSLLREQGQYARVFSKHLAPFKAEWRIKSQERHAYVRQSVSRNELPIKRLYGVCFRTLPPLTTSCSQGDVFSHELSHGQPSTLRIASLASKSVWYKNPYRIFPFVEIRLNQSVWYKNPDRICPFVEVEFDDDFNPTVTLHDVRRQWLPADTGGLEQPLHGPTTTKKFYVDKLKGLILDGPFMVWKLQREMIQGELTWVFDAIEKGNNCDGWRYWHNAHTQLGTCIHCSHVGTCQAVQFWMHSLTFLQTAFGLQFTCLRCQSKPFMFCTACVKELSMTEHRAHRFEVKEAYCPVDSQCTLCDNNKNFLASGVYIRRKNRKLLQEESLSESNTSEVNMEQLELESSSELYDMMVKRMTGNLSDSD